MQSRSFLTSTLVGGEWLTSRPYLRKITPVLTEYAAVEPITFWTFWRRQKSLASTGIRTPDRPALSIFTIPATLPLLKVTKQQDTHIQTKLFIATSVCATSRL
jgi:hypothetical protein